MDEARVPFRTELREGSSGLGVRTIQYYLNIIAYFNPSLNLSPLDGVFGPATTQAVRDFQSFYGLPVTGVVNTATWNTMTRIYSQTVSALPEGYSGQNAKLYPGSVLSIGISNDDVRDLQTYLSFIGRYYAEIPEIPVTGYYGTQTRDAVRAFQSLFGINPSGAVGAVTWNTIASQYDFLVSTEGVS